MEEEGTFRTWSEAGTRDVKTAMVLCFSTSTPCQTAQTSSFAFHSLSNLPLDIKKNAYRKMKTGKTQYRDIYDIFFLAFVM